MAIKKVKFPNNTTLDINDARVVSDAIAYIGSAEGSATYVDSGQTVDLSDYAKKASPALTGTPTAPTASSGTNTTQIATTAFVQTAVSGKQNTLVSGTNIKTVNSTSLLGSGNISITVPTISTSITSDATSDTKTASPKAVKTYVDDIVGDIETLLAAI